MTLPRLAAFTRYWRKHPPTHLLLAAVAGHGARPDEERGQDLSALVAWFKAGGGRA
ncbi:MAG TPA: hypothetical protein VKY65_17940 [Alphaproteobacteria bacterium]|nr:hypothetical protein [Alphaproteobacteria bacterium]